MSVGKSTTSVEQLQPFLLLFFVLLTCSTQSTFMNVWESQTQFAMCREHEGEVCTGW